LDDVNLKGLATLHRRSATAVYDSAAEIKWKKRLEKLLYHFAAPDCKHGTILHNEAGAELEAKLLWMKRLKRLGGYRSVGDQQSVDG
jgi:hypothetical protein